MIFALIDWLKIPTPACAITQIFPLFISHILIFTVFYCEYWETLLVGLSMTQILLFLPVHVSFHRAEILSLQTLNQIITSLYFNILKVFQYWMDDSGVFFWEYAVLENILSLTSQL